MTPLARKRLLLERARARRAAQMGGLLGQGAFLMGPAQDSIVERARQEINADRASRGWNGTTRPVTTPIGEPLTQTPISLKDYERRKEDEGMAALQAHMSEGIDARGVGMDSGLQSTRGVDYWRQGGSPQAHALATGAGGREPIDPMGLWADGTIHDEDMEAFWERIPPKRINYLTKTPTTTPTLTPEEVLLAREGLLPSDLEEAGKVNVMGGPLSQVAPAPSAPAVSAPAAQTPQYVSVKAQESPDGFLDKFTNNYANNVQKRKKMISAASMLFGIPDRSKQYEARAMSKYTTLMDNRAARMSIGSKPRTQMEMVSAYLKAGGSLEGLKSLSSSVSYDVTKPEAPKQLTYEETDPKTGKIYKVSEWWDPKTGEVTVKGRTEVTGKAGDPLPLAKHLRTVRDSARKNASDLIKGSLKEIAQVETARSKVIRTSAAPSDEELTAFQRRYQITDQAIEKMGSEGIRDIALINSYQRMIDPATVREGDVALQQASASAQERAGIYLARLREGKFLTPEQRTEMRRLADNFYYAYLESRMPDIEATRNLFKQRYDGPTGHVTLNDAAVQADFSSVVPMGSYKRWKKFMKDNPELASDYQLRELAESYGLTLEEAKQEAAAAGMTVYDYLDLKRLDRLELENEEFSRV